MNLVGVQFDIAWEDKPGNFDRVSRLLARCAPAKGSLVALPEMFATGFTMNADMAAEPRHGQTERFLAKTALEHGVFLVAGAAVLSPDGRPQNQALVFSPDGALVASYAKMRLFSPGGENSHYTPGTEPVSFSWHGRTVAPFICYDIRFPEIFRTVAAAARPEVFVVIANWPEKRKHHWTPLLRARAIENQAYVLAVNRIGNDPILGYAGRSLIIDPQGDIIAEAGETEAAITAAPDFDTLDKYRRRLPFLADMV